MIMRANANQMNNKEDSQSTIHKGKHIPDILKVGACIFCGVLAIYGVIHNISSVDSIPDKAILDESPIILNNVGYHYRFYRKEDDKYILYFATAVEPDQMDELKVITYSTYLLLKNGWLEDIKHPEDVELQAVFFDSKDNAVDYSSVKPIKVPLKQFIDMGLQKYEIKDPNSINMSLQTSPDQKGEVISFQQDVDFEADNDDIQHSPKTSPK